MDLEKAELLAQELMKHHGLTDRGRNWSFKWDSAKARYGLCNWTERTISLSSYLTPLVDENKVRNTILHEIAHALCPGHHHDNVWKAKAIEIGCNGKRCSNSEEHIDKLKPWKGVCPNCSYTYYRHKKGKGACGKCCRGRYNPAYKLVWNRDLVFIKPLSITEQKPHPYQLSASPGQILP